MPTPNSFLNLPRKFVRMCRKNWRLPKVSDSTGVNLDGGQLLLRTLVLRRALRKIIGEDEKFVGVLLPPTAGGVVVNAALGLDRRVSVNLNYTVTSDVMNDCIRQSNIKHIVTSRRVLDKLDLKLDAELILLEDVKDKISLLDKLNSLFLARWMPIPILERMLGLTREKPDDLLTVIFTSGSTGWPKGVMLTHENVGSNVEAVDEIIRLTRDDVLLGILPFFHSFGYTVTLWTVLALDPKGVYHFSPLEAREVGKLSRKHGVTIMLSTPTFLRSYARRCEDDDFRTVQVLFTGAEKLPSELADAFEQRFGIRPIEGYGCTELSPIAAANIPPGRGTHNTFEGVKEGTIGRPLPGIKAKVVDLDTGETLGPNQTGMLLFHGLNVMKGYLNRPDLTKEVIRDGWYVTGDVAEIDEEGFITITGRISRFSKLAGEMVPHLRIEETLVHVLGLEDAEEISLVVTAVPDAKKGEKIVVLHTGLSIPPEEICRKLAEAGLPPLWIPGADSFRQVEKIPILGTGKLDLKAVKDLAVEIFSEAVC
jgi:acyl-[acyl-carrier-protein]-phospholipid O-acyltransferase/long-chain-fatty-acid--[acyl-carrier-protein] ligase